MKCSKCGAELSEDTKFCSYCGNKIEIQPKQENAPEDVPPTSSDEPVQDFQGKKEAPKSLADKIKGKALNQWGKLSTYGKIATVALAVFALLFIASLLSGKTAAIIISVLQIALATVAVLMHRETIKLEQKKLWLKWLLLGIAALFTVLNVMSYSWSLESKNKATPNSNSDTSIVATPVAAPYGESECLGQDYSTIQAAFSAAGFTNIEAEKVEDLQAADVDKVNTIDAISVGGKTDFAKDQEFKSDDEVLIRYHGYAKCSVKIHVDFIPNLIFSKYDVNLLMNGIEEGTLAHGEDQDFEFSVDPGEYTLTFESDESSSVKGEVTLKVDCDIEASYKISCYSDKVTVETLYVDRLTELAADEVKMSVDASDYIYKDYKEVESDLSSLGFTNIQYNILYDIVWGWTNEGEVKSVSIDGNDDFTRGNVFKKDAPIIITYHMKEENDPNKQTETVEPSSEPSTSDDSTSEQKFDLDKDLYVAQCTQDSDKTTMYHITFAERDANGNYTTFYTFGSIINPRAMGNEFNAIGPLPSWFYVGALVHVQANLSGGEIKQSSCTVTKAAASSTEVTTSMPTMAGSSLDSVVSTAQSYGLSTPYSDEDWGHGSKMRSMSNNKFSIDVVYSSSTTEVLMVSMVSYAANSTLQEQKEFITAISTVACPAADSATVSQWVSNNVGNAGSTEIAERTYELYTGPSGNLCYNAGVSEWEAWDLSVN